MVVKNSLARRATEGTALAPAFEGVEARWPSLWGGDDLVSLAKEVVRIAGQKEFAPFAPQGGVMDGQQLSADEVTRSQQVAQPRRTVEHPGRTDFEPRCEPVGPIARPGGKQSSKRARSKQRRAK